MYVGHLHVQHSANCITESSFLTKSPINFVIKFKVEIILCPWFSNWAFHIDRYISVYNTLSPILFNYFVIFD